jgi:hypothetical protein
MQVKDLELGEGRYGAVALSRPGPLPAVLPLPATEEGLTALLG